MLVDTVWCFLEETKDDVPQIYDFCRSTKDALWDCKVREMASEQQLSTENWAEHLHTCHCAGSTNVKSKRQYFITKTDYHFTIVICSACCNSKHLKYKACLHTYFKSMLPKLPYGNNFPWVCSDIPATVDSGRIFKRPAWARDCPTWASNLLWNISTCWKI